MAKITDLEEFDLDGFKAEQATLSDNLKKLDGFHNTIKTQLEAVQSDSITTAEFKERMDRITHDLTGLADKIKLGQNANRVEENRYVYSDYRSMVEGVDWLYKEDGMPYADLDYRAHALFQMPVKYESLDNGNYLRNLRNLHDAVYIVDRVHTYRAARGGSRYRIEDLPLFKSLTKHVAIFDKDLAHAMAGGNAGFGAEWLPVEMSNEFNEVLRILPSLMNRFQTWNIPKGSSGRFPFQNGKAKAYKGGEALVDNGAQARKTNVATEDKTFTPSLFIAALVSSEEVTEDAIIGMIDFIRKELAMALNEGLESALINGDTTSPHMDNGAATIWQTYDLETSFKGLRRLAVDGTATIDAEDHSTTTGVGALQVDALLALQSTMGLAAVNPGEMFWLTGLKGRIELMKALQKEDALGILQFIISGQLPTLYGAPIHISGQYYEAQETDGFAGATADHTSICGVHPSSYRIGQRRGITLEAAKDILTQQVQIVATSRWDFGRVSATSENPVAAAINIEHT